MSNLNSTAVPVICPECNKEITETTCKLFKGAAYHEKCYKAAENKVEGRPYPCPECKTEGVMQHEGFCELCKGFGYTDKRYVPNMVQRGWKEYRGKTVEMWHPIGTTWHHLSQVYHPDINNSTNYYTDGAEEVDFNHRKEWNEDNTYSYIINPNAYAVGKISDEDSDSLEDVDEDKDFI